MKQGDFRFWHWSYRHYRKTNSIITSIIFRSIVLLVLLYACFLLKETLPFVICALAAVCQFVHLILEMQSLLEYKRLKEIRVSHKYQDASNVFRHIKITAFKNYIAVIKSKGGCQNTQLIKFEYPDMQNGLIQEEVVVKDQKKVHAYIYGSLDKKGKKIFSPSITFMFISMMHVVDYINKVIESDETFEANRLKSSLLNIITFSSYLEQAFLFLHSKIEVSKMKDQDQSKYLNAAYLKCRKNLAYNNLSFFKSGHFPNIKEEQIENPHFENVTYQVLDMTDHYTTFGEFVYPADIIDEYIQFMVMRNIPPQYRDAIYKALEKLSSGDRSTIEASLSMPNSQIGTAKDSNNYKFLSILKKIGHAKEIEIDIDGTNCTSFLIKEEAKTLIGALLELRND